MQVQRISNNNNYNTNFYGFGHHTIEMAQQEKRNVTGAIRRASETIHRSGRDTFV